MYLLTLNLAVETNERFSGIHLSLNSILDLGYKYNQCLTGLSESKKIEIGKQAGGCQLFKQEMSVLLGF